MDIASILAAIDKGRFSQELTETLERIGQACKETQGTGALTIKIKVKPSGDDALSLGAEFAEKMPTSGRRESIFFTDNDGTLTRHNPEQPGLPFDPRTRNGTDGHEPGEETQVS